MFESMSSFEESEASIVVHKELLVTLAGPPLCKGIGKEEQELMSVKAAPSARP